MAPKVTVTTTGYDPALGRDVRDPTLEGDAPNPAERAATAWVPEGPRTIPMAPGYAVDEDGRVFSVASNWRGYGTRQLIAALNADGYPSVRLYIGGKRKRISVHRLVADAFLPPRPSLSHEIRHLDGSRTNSRRDNICWGTRAENAADRDRHGRTFRGERASQLRRALTAGSRQPAAPQSGDCLL